MLAVKSMYMEEQPVVKPHRLTNAEPVDDSGDGGFGCDRL